MIHKNITIDIIGCQQEIIENECELLKAITQASVRSYLLKDCEGYFANSRNKADVIIVNLSQAAARDLKVVESANVNDQAVIVIGDKSNAELLSIAISARVTEFINASDYHKNLFRVVNKTILNRSISFNRHRKRNINVILNAKGGSGASFIASNVAYKLSQYPNQDVALLDMDLQFGSIGLNFDIVSKYTIMDAITEIEDIDYASLDGYLCKYNEHLKLLLPSSDEIVLPGEIRPESLKALLFMLQSKYSQIVVDLPRIIDPVFTMTLEQADHIVVVVQQTLAQYRDGRRLIQVLNKDLDIPLDKIVVAINRYNPKSSLKKTDMMEVVHHDHVFTITNDYIQVASASNLGEPLCQSAPKSKVAKDLKELAIYLGEIPEQKKTGISGLLKRILGD